MLNNDYAFSCHSYGERCFSFSTKNYLPKRRADVYWGVILTDERIGTMKMEGYQICSRDKGVSPLNVMQIRIYEHKNHTITTKISKT